MNVLRRRELEHADGRRVVVYGSVGDASLNAQGGEMQLRGIHRRLDLLTGEWVIISPHRNARPNDPEAVEDTDRGCPICPGGVELPFSYDACVFENRFPSLVAHPPTPTAHGPSAPARGRCEVVVYTARHEASFGGLTGHELGRLLAIWIDRCRVLWSDERHQFVFPFENRGPEAGATLSHPHGQIYALDHLPPVTQVKTASHRRHREQRAECLSCVLVDDAASRTVAPNDTFAVAVPFAPRWPYEVAVRARRHGLGRLADLAPDEQVDLIRALRDVALRYDLLFGEEMPYLMTVQEAPRGEPDWHLAVEFYPLRRGRAATKIRASVETATGVFLNDVLPETAAARLSALEVEAEAVGPEHLASVAPANPLEVGA